MACSRFGRIPYWRLGLLVCCLGQYSTLATAEDVVVLQRRDGGQAQVHGMVEDFTGETLTLRLTGGDLQQYPATQILAVQTEHCPAEVQGDSAFAEHRFADALPLYEQAFEGEAEPRRWVRRQIAGRIIRCYKNLDRLTEAGTLFLALAKDDPTTRDFSAIPLAWLPSEPSPRLQQLARQWLQRTDDPVARLLGASHLLLGVSSATAEQALAELAMSSDERVQALALAQAWRPRLREAPEAELARWEEQLATMPDELRAGPYYLLGKGLQQRGRTAEAAWALLRVPVLYADERRLAAECLSSAGRLLAADGQADAAQLVLEELVRDYGDSPLSADAAATLQSLPQPTP